MLIKSEFNANDASLALFHDVFDKKYTFIIRHDEGLTFKTEYDSYDEANKEYLKHSEV